MAHFTLRQQSLSALDDLGHDVLVLQVFNNEKPLRGLSGYVDWRLNGKLSALLKEGWLRGETDDRLLTTADGRIGTERLLVIGLGDSGSFDTKGFQAAQARMISVLAGLQSKDVALELAGSQLTDRPFDLESLATMAYRFQQVFDGRVTIFVPPHHDFEEISRRFEFILKEIRSQG